MIRKERDPAHRAEMQARRRRQARTSTRGTVSADHAAIRREDLTSNGYKPHQGPREMARRLAGILWSASK